MVLPHASAASDDLDAARRSSFHRPTPAAVARLAIGQLHETRDVRELGGTKLRARGFRFGTAARRGPVGRDRVSFPVLKGGSFGMFLEKWLVLWKASNYMFHVMSGSWDSPGRSRASAGPKRTALPCAWPCQGPLAT